MSGIKDKARRIGKALSSGPNSIRCPGCNAFYVKETGCNYVQCAYQSCSIWFCYKCGQPVESIAHFGKLGGCNFGPTDLYRASYVIRMLFLTNLTGIFLLLPAVIYSALVLLPITVSVIFVYKANKKLTSCFTPTVSIIMKLLFVLPLSIIGLLVAIIFWLIGLIIVTLYLMFLVFRFLPIGVTLTLALKLMPIFAKFFGVDSIEDLIRDAQDDQFALEIEAYFKEQERLETAKASVTTLSVQQAK